MSLDCPINCESAKLNPNFSECTPKVYFGEIEEIAVANSDFEGFTDVTDENEWATHKESGDIEILIVKASLEEPEREEYESTKGSTIFGSPTTTINFEIHDLSDENLTMLQNSYCNTKHKVWLRTGSLVIGGNDGFDGASIKMWISIEQGATPMNKIMGSLKFRYETQTVNVIGSNLS